MTQQLQHPYPSPAPPTINILTSAPPISPAHPETPPLATHDQLPNHQHVKNGALNLTFLLRLFILMCSLRLQYQAFFLLAGWAGFNGISKLACIKSSWLDWLSGSSPKIWISYCCESLEGSDGCSCKEHAKIVWLRTGLKVNIKGCEVMSRLLIDMMLIIDWLIYCMINKIYWSLLRSLCTVFNYDQWGLAV